MLVELSISNFAIIKDLKIEFTEGLNLLTGETGSGKSILVEALGIILGGRASKDLISSGSNKAILQALFYIKNEDRLIPILDKYGLELEDDKLLIVTREISQNSPSVSRVNGQIVTLSILNEITFNLVDIFGQHEHQSLLNISNHKRIIDSFGDTSFNELKFKISGLYKLYNEEINSLNRMTMDSQERIRKIDLLKFQIEEIEDADLVNIKEADIENEYNKLLNTETIYSTIGEIVESFNSSIYDKQSIIDSLNRSVYSLRSLEGFDTNLNPITKRLESMGFELEDINIELNSYLNNLEINEERLTYLKDKINLINNLKKKYGQTIEEILNYKEEINKELKDLIDYEKRILQIKNNIKIYEKELYDLSSKLSSKRKKISKNIEKKISDELLLLNMGKVIFKVNFKENPNLTSDGFDIIEFLISTNPGENLKPLSKIVSGGEMSRIMLAFKSILADVDQIPTLIFDEIDSGISGRTAQIVGEKIKKISRNHQVISISHLPQLAALSDSHYVIYKELEKDKTISNIKRLSYDERITELARLLGGVNVTDTTLNHAREMLEMSKIIDY